MRAVGKEQFVAFSLYAVALTTASRGLELPQKAFNLSGMAIKSENRD